MRRAEECRRYAVECVRLAHRSSSPGDKAALFEMAQKWRELAERAEHNGDKEPLDA
jgi:hypothetical protein